MSVDRHHPYGSQTVRHSCGYDEASSVSGVRARWRPYSLEVDPISAPWKTLTEPGPAADWPTPASVVRDAVAILLWGHLGGGGLGTVWGGHLSHGGGKAGGRRAGRLGDGVALRLAKVAELFRRPAAAGRRRAVVALAGPGARVDDEAQCVPVPRRVPVAAGARRRVRR